ncbi:DUF421 domain-containing protein [Citricoccus alkalitolerans]|uniref:DUF421 domain-containing protein n=1 Tax=Citricoccus alkalitolerans TaxID=246603 RepID=A0ABV8Y2K0_9MICC
MLDWSAFLELSLPVGELLVRGTITFLGLMLLLRLVGQRESGGLGMTDLLVIILIADAASAGLTGDAQTIADGAVLVGTILLWSILLDAVAYRWPQVGRLLKARPKPLIENGRLNRRAMRREFMAETEVTSQLRLHGIEDIHEVERAYIEPNGMISVIPRQDTETTDTPEPPAT